MAEGEDKKQEKPASKIDAVFAWAGDALNNAADGKSFLSRFIPGGLGGDAEMKKRVDALGIDKVLERAIAMPFKAMATPVALASYAGTRVFHGIASRRRFAAEMYLKGTGPWMGTVYGNADRIVKRDPKYAELYIQERTALDERNTAFETLKDTYQAAIDAEFASGIPNMAIVTTSRTALRDLNRKMKNPALSLAIAPPGDAVDAINVRLATPATGIQAQLNAERAAYLPNIPVYKQYKQHRMQKAARHVEWKKNLASDVKNATFGSFRYEDYRTKLETLYAQIDIELARTGGVVNDAIIKLQKDMAKLNNSMSWSDHLGRTLHGSRAV